MHWRAWSVVFVALFTACSGGRPPDEPAALVPWTPGRYLLEAELGSTAVDVTGGGTSANELEAELRIEPGGDMMLLTPFGACTDPTNEELERDEQLRRRRFSCGDAVYVVRPTQDGVRGEVRARILEEYQQRVQCAPNNAGPCYMISTRRVVRTVRLRVSEIGQ